MLKSTRLGPHSKGDDTRSKKELKKLFNKDPLKKLEKNINLKKRNKIQNEAKVKIDKIFHEISLNQDNKIRSVNNQIPKNKIVGDYLADTKIFDTFKGKRFGEKLIFFPPNFKKIKKYFF